MRASRTEVADPATLADRPQWHADPQNVFVVVDGHDEHVSLLDGDRFEVFHRFRTRVLQGKPVFSPDGRYAYLPSVDGWLAKYDLWNLVVVAEVRTGPGSSELALSADGLWLVAANASLRTVALFDPDLRLARTYPVTTLDGRFDSRVAAIYDASPRRSFILALKDIAELWEISYDLQAEPIYDGLVHDYRMREGIAKPGFLGVRRVPLDAPMEGLLFDPSYRNAIGAGDPSRRDGGRARVVNFDVRRVIATIPMADAANLAAGIGFTRKEGTVLAFPLRDRAEVIVVDTRTWKTVGTIPTPGRGSYLSSHPQSAHVWVDSRLDPSASDEIAIIGKQSLQTQAPVRELGGAVADVEFTRDGRHALVSTRGPDGSIVVLDTASLEVVDRLPIRNPVGIYNVASRAGKAGRASAR